VFGNYRESLHRVLLRVVSHVKRSLQVLLIPHLRMKYTPLSLKII